MLYSELVMVFEIFNTCQGATTNNRACRSGEYKSTSYTAYCVYNQCVTGNVTSLNSECFSKRCVCYINSCFAHLFTIPCSCIAIQAYSVDFVNISYCIILFG